MAAADAAAGDGGEPLSVGAGPLQEMPSVLACSLHDLQSCAGVAGGSGLLPLRDPTHPAVSPET